MAFSLKTYPDRLPDKFGKTSVDKRQEISTRKFYEFFEHERSRREKEDTRAFWFNVLMVVSAVIILALYII